MRQLGESGAALSTRWLQNSQESGSVAGTWRGSLSYRR